jgi:hypothetical protein
MHKYPGLTTRSPGTTLKQTNKPTEQNKLTLNVHSPFQSRRTHLGKAGEKALAQVLHPTNFAGAIHYVFFLLVRSLQ